MTRSSKHAPRDFADVLSRLDHLTALLAVGSFAVCIGLFFFNFGFDLGLHSVAKVPPDHAITFAVHGEETYHLFSFRYGFAIIALLTVLLIRVSISFFSSERTRSVLFAAQLMFLLPSLYLLYSVLSFKSDRSQTSFWNEPYDLGMRGSYPFDWVLFVMIFLAVLLNLSYLILRLMPSRQR